MLDDAEAYATFGGYDKCITFSSSVFPRNSQPEEILDFIAHHVMALYNFYVAVRPGILYIVNRVAKSQAHYRGT